MLSSQSSKKKKKKKKAQNQRNKKTKNENKPSSNFRTKSKDLSGGAVEEVTMCRPLPFPGKHAAYTHQRARNGAQERKYKLIIPNPGAQSPGPQKEGKERNDGKGERDRAEQVYAEENENVRGRQFYPTSEDFSIQWRDSNVQSAILNFQKNFYKFSKINPSLSNVHKLACILHRFHQIYSSDSSKDPTSSKQSTTCQEICLLFQAYYLLTINQLICLSGGDVTVPSLINNDPSCAHTFCLHVLFTDLVINIYVTSTFYFFWAFLKLAKKKSNLHIYGAQCDCSDRCIQYKNYLNQPT